MNRSQRIGILLSGRAGQREAALRQGQAILAALNDRGHDAIPVFLEGEMDLLLRQADLDTALVATQGRYGSDGCLQGFLEILGIPYTGSNVLASAVASDLVKTREILRFHNLPTAAGYVFDACAGTPLLDAHGSFGFPVTVRPVGDSQSVDPILAFDELDLEGAVEEALRLDDRVLIERAMSGKIVWVGLLDGAPLGAVEASKHSPSRPVTSGGVRDTDNAVVACHLPAERLRSVLSLATRSYEALGLEGAACVAIQVSEKGNENIRSIDSAPVFSPASPLARAARMAGLSFADLMSKIVAGAALRGHGRRDNRRQVQLSIEAPERRRDAHSHAH